MGMQHDASDEQPNFLGPLAASERNEARDLCVLHPEDGFEEMREGLKAEEVRLVDEEAGTPGIGVGWLILGDICVHL